MNNEDLNKYVNNVKNYITFRKYLAFMLLAVIIFAVWGKIISSLIMLVFLTLGVILNDKYKEELLNG